MVRVPGQHIVLAVAPDARGPEGHLRETSRRRRSLRRGRGRRGWRRRSQAGGLDAGMQAGLGQGIADVGLRRGLVETAVDLADACVADAEADLAVGHVQRPDAWGQTFGQGHNGLLRADG